MDIWEKNAEFIQTEKAKRLKKRSSDEQSEKSVHTMNEIAHQMNTSSENCSSDERNCSHSDTLQRTTTENPSDREGESENEARSSKDSHATHTYSLLFEKAIKFIQRRGTVNFSDLEKYLGRYMDVKGTVNVPLNYKNLVGWTGTSHEFLQLLLKLQADDHIRIGFCSEEMYPPKARRPKLPVVKQAADQEVLHWQPMYAKYVKQKA